MNRQLLTVLSVLALALLAWWFFARSGAGGPAPDSGYLPAPAPDEPGDVSAPISLPAARALPTADADFPLAAELNAPDSTAVRDLDLVSQILDAWRSNFPREGNPVGQNVEITAALTGRNLLDLALLPRTHRAINSRGELCDRWGTPLHFHQLSGEHMELRSAGPDRDFGTADDVRWMPADEADLPLR